MRHYLRSNSILIAADYGGGDEERRGLAFIGLQDSFGFSIDTPRSISKQLGSQKLVDNSINFSPDISLDLSFIPTRKFDTESLLGLNFGFNAGFKSVFLGKSEKFCNLYLFISNLQSFDFIRQLRSAQSLNGVECLAFGNCYLNNYGFSMSAGDLARATASMVSSNIEASFISDNKVRVPQINLETGESLGNAFLSLDWAQVEKALDEIESFNQSILPTTELKFNVSNSNIDVPSAILSPLLDAKIQSLNFSIDIPRETSYGFGSNFPYARKIKYPVNGQLSVSTIFSTFNSGNFSGLMASDQEYSVQMNFLDPQELFLSEKNYAELSGFFATGISGATGFFTDSRSLLINGAKVNGWSQSFPINGFTEFNANLSFQCSESGGLMSRFGTNNGSQPYYFYTEDARKIYDSSGNLLSCDEFLYLYGDDCSRNYLMDGNGDLLLAENWSEQDNVCIYPLPSPAPAISSIVDSGNLIVSFSSSNHTNSYICQMSEDLISYSNVATGSSSPINVADGTFSRGNESFYYFRIVASGNGGFTTGDSQSIYIA